MKTKKLKRYNNILEHRLTVEEYIAKKLTGLTDKRIAMDYFVSIHTLNRWKSNKGIKKRDINYQRFIQIKNLSAKNYKIWQIAIKLNISERQCYNILRQFKNKGMRTLKMSTKEIKRIKLNEEQTKKFLMCFVEDAKRIVIERKQKKQTDVLD